MEQTPLPPLLSDEILAHLNCRCENCVRRVAKVIEADRAKIREVVQALVDALNGSVWPNAISADELALLALGNAGSHNQIDSASGIASDHRASQEASRAALALAKSQLNIEPTKP